jgi:EAL domain-containing protein (putative c-di-GMP-specific phosphodiesterase class I)/CheY-like chemotaxis protein
MTAQSRTAQRRVLVIDDNPAIHEDVRKILAPQPATSHELAAEEAILFGEPNSPGTSTIPDLEFQIDTALQGKEGIALADQARQEHRSYALAFVDARMPPGLDGIETIARLWEADPDIQVVLCTAYSDYSWAQIRRRLRNPEQLIILKKPFDNIEVQQLAESLTEKWWRARTERDRLTRLEGLISERNRDVLSARAFDTQLATCDGSSSQPDAVQLRRAAIEQGLRRAVTDAQLYLHYQPLVDIATRSIVGLEALLRWKHPQLGVVSPAEFVPIAESSGLIVPIGEFVLRTACAQIRRWERAQVPIVPVSVNVSAVQLINPGIWSCIRRILKEEGGQPRHLVLEITESSFMENGSRHAAALQGLRADGMAIEIDDFGTGYSSLSCLKHLPLDTIKIDRSFVTHLGTNVLMRQSSGQFWA